jgi:hypothetical protein
MRSGLELSYISIAQNKLPIFYAGGFARTIKVHEKYLEQQILPLAKGGF